MKSAGGAPRPGWERENGERLRAWMRWAGFPAPGRLAEQVGVAENTINAWIYANRHPNVNNLGAVAKVLGITADELYYQDPPEGAAPLHRLSVEAGRVSASGSPDPATAAHPAWSAAGAGGVLVQGDRLLLVGVEPESAERMLGQWLQHLAVRPPTVADPPAKADPPAEAEPRKEEA